MKLGQRVREELGKITSGDFLKVFKAKGRS